MPCLVPTYNFEIYQGDTYKLIFTITGDFTAKQPKLQLRTPIGATTATLTLDGVSGITMLYDAGNDWTLFECTFTATQTAALVATSIYFYDFEITDGSVVKTYFQGQISLTAQKTKA